MSCYKIFSWDLYFSEENSEGAEWAITKLLPFEINFLSDLDCPSIQKQIGDEAGEATVDDHNHQFKISGVQRNNFIFYKFELN